MAPRKKRGNTRAATGRKTRSAAQKQSTKPVDIVAAEMQGDSSEKPIQRKVKTTPTHKKFGKFRCLLENTSTSDDIAATEGEHEHSTEIVSTEDSGCQEMEECTVSLEPSACDQEKIEEYEEIVEAVESEKEQTELDENVLLAMPSIDLQQGTEIEDNTVIELPNEISLQSSEMEYTEIEEQSLVENLATEVTEQLSSLNFNIESNTASTMINPVDMDEARNDPEIAVDCAKLASPTNIFNEEAVPSEFTVECVSEEVIPVLGEQEIEIGNTTDTEVEAVVEDNSTGDALEQQPVTSEVCKKEEEESQNVIEVTPDKIVKPKNRNTQQKGKPKTVIRKKPAVIAKANKREPKNKKKPLDKINSDTSESSTTSENSVRRSSRIKSISVLKQRSKGQGLVKPKTDVEIRKLLKNNFNDSDTSENSNSGHTDSEKTSADSPNFLTPISGYDSDHKPVKVKSRWRRSSELEMGNSAAVSGNKTCLPPNGEGVQSQLSAPPLATDDKNDNNSVANQEEIRTRMKQFIHLKENQYLTSRVCCKEAKKMICDCFLTSEELERGELGCGEDCLNRLLMIECGPLCPLNDRCTNKRFQKSQFFPCEVFHTDKKGLGIRATANIPYGEFILEYIGEVIGPDEFEERATEYSKGKNPHYYFMSLRSDAVIDATQKGNISRFINHSCEPNAETQKWTVNGELRIGFFSKRTILAGEEITFDYQFQRYGKEAQKCYCEAATCRGWLGEEPDEDEDEEEEDEEEEEHEEAIEVNKVIEKEVQQLLVEPTVEAGEQPAEESEKILPGTVDIPTVTPAVDVEIKKPVKKEKRKVIKRKVRKDIFDDVDVDEEIEMLITTGLKNQAHTLKLSRLMVRANESTQRTALLRILRHGEFPCRRLFLDYHGLRLIHGWMNDAQQMCKTDKKQESLRLELLQTLATLPIPNKTMLQDSKVLPTVETWATKLEDLSTGLDSESNSPKIENDSTAVNETDSNVQMEIQMQKAADVKVDKDIVEDSAVKTEEEVTVQDATIKLEEENKTFNKGNDVESAKTQIDTNTSKESESLNMHSELDSKLEESEEIRRSVGMNIEYVRCKGRWFIEQDNEKLVQDIIDMFDDDMDISPIAFNDDDHVTEINKENEKSKQEEKDYETEIIALALKLLEEWSGLKEVFRIPKKERIEQMKEHEREANRGYKAGLELDSERKSSSRYRGLDRRKASNDKVDFSERVRKGLKIEDRCLSTFPKINKHERRKLFAMQVEQEEVEKRLKQRDMWRQHELNCMAMGTDPRFTAPYDPTRSYQCIWNQQTGQWQNYPIINHNPLLNPNMAPRFGAGMHYSYNTSGSVLPLSNMPPNMSLASTTMPLAPSNMSHPIPNIPHSAF